MQFNQLMSKLAKPAQRALNYAQISSFEQLMNFSEEELMALHGIGKSALVTIKAALLELNLSLRDNNQTTN